MKLSLKAWVGIAVTGSLLLAAGWYLFLSPKDTAVSSSLADSTVGSNQHQTISGAVTPATQARVVVLEESTGSGWKDLGRTATDATGQYKLVVPSEDDGVHHLRVTVLSAGRQSEAHSPVHALEVLEPTELRAQVPPFARADRALRIAGRIFPAAVRGVVVETSIDGVTWSRSAIAASSAEGQFSAYLKHLAPGPIDVRVSVSKSATSAPAVGSAARVSVEDYKAAGRRYLQIVSRANSILDEYSKLPTYGAFTIYQKLDARMSHALTQQARAFGRYTLWPHEVQRNIGLMARSDILEADMYSQAAHARTQDAYNAVQRPDYPKGSSNAPVLVRAALGLPKRR